MNTKLYLSKDFVLGSGRSRVSIPDGFPIVVNQLMEIVKPILLFLFSTFVNRRLKRAANTWLAYANDMRAWWDFLDHVGIHWREATDDDFNLYLDGLKNSINPRSGLPYAQTTCVRRANTVIAFYNHAWREQWVAKDRAKSMHAPPAGNYLGTVQEHDDDDDEIRLALFPAEFQAITEFLGPSIPISGRSEVACRNRLWAELMVLTGMRPAQPESIKVQEILNLEPIDFEDDTGVTYLTLTVKGNKKRRLRIPNLVLKKLLWYIGDERKAAVDKGVELGHFKSGDVTALFVNGLDAKHNIGFPAKYHTFYTAFKDAVHRAHELGLLKNRLMSISVEDPISGETIEKNVIVAHPHILRHTFTIWNVAAEKSSGNTEPYKSTSAQLGHKNVSTTINIYSKSVGEFEAMLSDATSASLIKLMQGNAL